jgi:Zn-finger nucleic acid-binding protein
MRGVSVGQNAMHECPSCASLWLDAPTFTRLCTSHEERGAVVAFIDVDRSTTRTPSAAAAAVRYVPCPVCAKIMNRQNFGRRSGVVVDVCKGHGVWFEANELQAALAFIDSGGFERARQDEEARKAEERAKLVKEFEQTGKELLILDRVQMSHQHGHTVSVHGTASPPDSALADVLRAFFS